MALLLLPTLASFYIFGGGALGLVLVIVLWCYCSAS
jgi:hypothetical protein